MIKLQSSDEQEFEVEKEVIKMSGTVNNLINDIGSDHPIPLPNVSGKTLAKVIEYCKYHYGKPIPEKTSDIEPWDLKFCEMEQSDLFELILAANYMDVSLLLDLTCKTVANMIKGKKVEEIRKIFNIQNDFTPEEEEQIRKENEWCEER